MSKYREHAVKQVQYALDHYGYGPGLLREENGVLVCTMLVDGIEITAKINVVVTDKESS